jgi:hypothetical protein
MILDDVMIRERGSCLRRIWFLFSQAAIEVMNAAAERTGRQGGSRNYQGLGLNAG